MLELVVRINLHRYVENVRTSLELLNNFKLQH